MRIKDHIRDKRRTRREWHLGNPGRTFQEDLVGCAICGRQMEKVHEEM